MYSKAGCGSDKAATLNNSTSRAALIVVAVALGFVMAMLDVTVVNVALESIRDEFNANLSELVWVIDAYTLTFAALLLLGGALADRIGAKKIYMIGLAWFIVASVFCGLSMSTGVLIAARLLQGLGAALFMPSSLSLLAESFPDKKARTKIVGIWGAIVGAAAGSGPFIGGVLVHFSGWRSIFFLNLPVGILGVLLTWKFVRPSPTKQHPFDIVSHGLITIALASLSFCLIEGPAFGWLSGWIVGAACLSLLSIVSVLWNEGRSRHPVLPAELVHHHRFWCLNGSGYLFNFVIFGEIFLMSVFLQQARGETALSIGLTLLPMMCVIPVGNYVAGHLSNVVGGQRVLCAGLTLGLLSLLGAFFVGQNFILLATLLALCNFGMAASITAIIEGVMHEAGRRNGNVAAATLNANRQVGALSGVAIVGVVLHQVPQWEYKLQTSFGLFVICVLAALILVMSSKESAVADS